MILSKHANNVFYGQWNTARVVTLDWILMLTVTLSIQFGVRVGILDLQIPKRSKKWIEKSFTRNTFSITYFIYLCIYYSFHLAIPRARTNAANAGRWAQWQRWRARGDPRRRPYQPSSTCPGAQRQERKHAVDNNNRIIAMIILRIRTVILKTVLIL